MNKKFKCLIVISFILISFTLINASFAANNATVDLTLDDSMDDEELSINDEDIIELSSNDEDILSDYVPYSGENILNPSFETELDGTWNFSGGISRNHWGWARNGGYALQMDQGSSASQEVNFNTIDSINFWLLPYTGGERGNVIVYCDDEVIWDITTPGSQAWHNFNLDVSNITGWHTLEFKVIKIRHYVDEISVVRSDAIDPYFKIDDIAVDDGDINVKFKDDSFGYISSWLWDFGDGNTSEEKNPTHVYSKPGVYNISLTISDGIQFAEISKIVNIKDIFSVDFTNNRNIGYKSLLVKFTDKSSGDIDSWFWNFGDGTNSTKQNPLHTYAQAGTYNVTLTVSNDAKSLNMTKNNLISVSDDLTADFNTSASENTYSFVVKFADLSTGNPTGYLWDFGDGSTSADKNPTHKYGDVGQYNVTLNISSSFNTTQITKTIIVKAKESFIAITDINKRLLVTGVLKDENGQILANETVDYQIGNVNASTVTDDDGVFTIQGNPNSTLKTSFSGNDETFSCENITELGDIQTKNAVISVSNPYKLVAVDTDSGEGAKYFTFYLKDIDGNKLQYKKLSVTLNGKTYEVNTDVNGKVSLAIKLSAAKTYTWKISFAGDDDYNSVAKTVKIVVSKKTTKITPKKTSYTFKKAAKTKYVQATLKTSNKYLKTGKKVTLTINGKKYTVKAGKNGAIKFNIASFKKKGTYKVKIKFAGDSTYKACTSKQISIKIK